MTSDDLRALIEQQHQLEELKKHPGWTVLEDYVLHGPAGSVARQKGLVNGGARDWDSYNKETGWLAGAHHVLNAAETVAGMVATERMQQGEQEQAAASDAA